MSFDASTPQLKAVKNMFDALISFDLGKIAALTSKNYQYEAFNGADLAKLDKESYAAMIQGVSTVVTKVDATYHEVIEAPGKVIIHLSALCGTASGTTFPYDTLLILSIEEEDGELKFLSTKNFPDAQQHNALMAGAATERGSSS